MGAEVKSMEMKKPQQLIAAEKNVSLKSAQQFISDVKSEVQKITWTSREELLTYTKIVVGATFAFGMSIYVLDLIIQTLLNSLNVLLQFVSG